MLKPWYIPTLYQTRQTKANVGWTSVFHKKQYSAGMRIQSIYWRFNVFKAKYKVSARSVGPEDFSGISKFVERNRLPFRWTFGQITSQSGFSKKWLKLVMRFFPKSERIFLIVFYWLKYDQIVITIKFEFGC
jgi:hypothetical protein